MANTRGARGQYHCSFCGKRRREVRKLISGPRVFICDECVSLCNDILAKEKAHPTPTPDTSSNRAIGSCSLSCAEHGRASVLRVKR